MTSDYVALGIFALLALFVPFSMVLIAKLLAAKTTQNSVKLQNYESAEVPIGTHRDITNDYLHYFPLYIGFEFTAVIVIAWAYVFQAGQALVNLSVIGLLIGAFAISTLAIIVAKNRNEI